MITEMDRSPLIAADRLPDVEGTAATNALPMLEPARHERADAARNRAAILEAAEGLVGDRGADGVTMDRSRAPPGSARARCSATSAIAAA